MKIEQINPVLSQVFHSPENKGSPSVYYDLR